VGPFSRRKVRADGPDRFVVRLDDTERRVLADVCDQLATALDEDEGVDAFRRLFPVAHPDDPGLEAGYRDLVHDELRTKRLADLRAVVDGADARELDRAGLERWMTAVNAVRLVLGTLLDVDESDPGALDPDDPSTPTRVVYHFLGGLLDEIVQALSSTL
jgi:hypothetical protein